MKSTLYVETTHTIRFSIEDYLGQLYVVAKCQDEIYVAPVESLTEGFELINRCCPPEIATSRALTMATVQTAVLTVPTFVLSPLLDGWYFAAAVVPISAGWFIWLNRFRHTPRFQAWMRKVPLERVTPWPPAIHKTQPWSSQLDSAHSGSF